jgi:hypothetical protein
MQKNYIKSNKIKQLLMILSLINLSKFSISDSESQSSIDINEKDSFLNGEHNKEESISNVSSDYEDSNEDAIANENSTINNKDKKFDLNKKQKKNLNPVKLGIAGVAGIASGTGLALGIRNFRKGNKKKDLKLQSKLEKSPVIQNEILSKIGSSNKEAKRQELNFSSLSTTDSSTRIVNSDQEVSDSESGSSFTESYYKKFSKLNKILNEFNKKTILNEFYKKKIIDLANLEEEVQTIYYDENSRKTEDLLDTFQWIQREKDHLNKKILILLKKFKEESFFVSYGRTYRKLQIQNEKILVFEKSQSNWILLPNYDWYLVKQLKYYNLIETEFNERNSIVQKFKTLESNLKKLNNTNLDIGLFMNLSDDFDLYKKDLSKRTRNKIRDEYSVDEITKSIEKSIDNIENNIILPQELSFEWIVKQLNILNENCENYLKNNNINLLKNLINELNQLELYTRIQIKIYESGPQSRRSQYETIRTTIFNYIEKIDSFINEQHSLFDDKIEDLVNSRFLLKKADSEKIHQNLTLEKKIKNYREMAIDVKKRIIDKIGTIYENEERITGEANQNYFIENRPNRFSKILNATRIFNSIQLNYHNGSRKNYNDSFSNGYGEYSFGIQTLNFHSTFINALIEEYSTVYNVQKDQFRKKICEGIFYSGGTSERLLDSDDGVEKVIRLKDNLYVLIAIFDLLSFYQHKKYDQLLKKNKFELDSNLSFNGNDLNIGEKKINIIEKNFLDQKDIDDLKNYLNEMNELDEKESDNLVISYLNKSFERGLKFNMLLLKKSIYCASLMPNSGDYTKIKKEIKKEMENTENIYIED